MDSNNNTSTVKKEANLNPFATTNSANPMQPTINIDQDNQTNQTNSTNANQTNQTAQVEPKAHHLQRNDKVRVRASMFNKVSKDFIQYSILRSNIVDPQSFTYTEDETVPWHKFDTVQWVNKCENS